MEFKLKAFIKLHPRLENAVEVFVKKHDIDVEHFVVNRANLDHSVSAAKTMILNVFPQLGEGDIDVQLSTSGEGNQSAV
jgi:hypothetical protein